MKITIKCIRGKGFFFTGSAETTVLIFYDIWVYSLIDNGS